MSLQTPAYSGSESIVGLTRETTWGTTPTSGSDPNKAISGIVFMPMKEENIQSQLSREPQTDDMRADREVHRIISNGSTVGGTLRMTAGPESIGYFLTAMFGSPTTTQLAASSGSYEGAYQHIWHPGLNTRTNWPAPYSIESQMAGVASKLIQGCLITRLPIDLPNNGPMMITPEFGVCKKLLWLTSASGGVDDRGNTLPAKITASPTIITEDEWHFKQLVAYPQIDDVNQQSVTSLSWEPTLAIEGLFTGGSGAEIGSYRVDNFMLSGRATMLFESDDLWEKFERGLNFELDATLRGSLIQGAYYNQLQILSYSCKANTDDVVNRVGSLEYDFAWTAQESAAQGKSCQITLINTVSSYA